MPRILGIQEDWLYRISKGHQVVTQHSLQPSRGPGIIHFLLKKKKRPAWLTVLVTPMVSLSWASYILLPSALPDAFHHSFMCPPVYLLLHPSRHAAIWSVWTRCFLFLLWSRLSRNWGMLFLGREGRKLLSLALSVSSFILLESLSLFGMVREADWEGACISRILDIANKNVSSEMISYAMTQSPCNFSSILKE